MTINYAGGGSGKGRTDLQNKLVDFAGSDGLIKAEDKPKYPGTVLYFPTVAGPITVSYNLPGIDNLKLTPDVIAKIFQREIKTWNDAAIKADNPRRQPPGHVDHGGPPLRRLGHDGAVHEVPRRRGPDRLEAGVRVHGSAGPPTRREARATPAWRAS